MAFNSLNFFVFLLFFLLIYYITNNKWKWLVLLIASLSFIFSFSTYFLIYTIIYASINYFVGLGIHRLREQNSKKLLYFFGVYLNIGLLIFYKYTNFLIGNLFDFLEWFDVELTAPSLNLIIPLGISFYTFQVLGYLIDVYRGTVEPERHLGKFVLFITYFPKYISGPVEKSTSLLPEINKSYSLNTKLFNEGVLQMLWGFIKTLIVADRFETFVFGVTGNLIDMPGNILLINIFIEFMFLYLNFSGYTDIVLGISKLFGIKLLDNFERPLLATNVSDFWRRWHMSLTNWCNDYIFRKVILKRIRWKKWASVYGVILTFVIIGIWHGASWNFVIMGFIYGVVLSYEFFTKRIRIRYGSMLPKWLNNVLSILLTFIIVSFIELFFFFGASDVWYYMTHVFSGGQVNISISKLGIEFFDIYISIIGAIIIFSYEIWFEITGTSVRDIILKNKILLYSIVIICVLILLTFGMESGTGSIYKQF